MKISKNLMFITLLALAVASTIVSCNPDDDEVDLIGNWIELADFGGDARHEAVAFSIGEIGYVGLGYNGDERLNDFWSYNADLNNWTLIATDTALTARTGAVAFTAGGKGYVGTGRDDNQELKDFWEYTPGTNTWKRVADFPVARYGAVAFSINETGYVGTGYNGSTLLDFYSYNPGTDTWAAIANYPTKVREAVAFVINNMGYVVTGEKNGEHIDDFFMYDPNANTWTALKKVSDASDASYDDEYAIIRQKAVAFTVAGKAYVTAGDLQGPKGDVWEYDAAKDTWKEITSFEGRARLNAVAFSTANGRGFVTTGFNGSSSYYDDLYELKPADDFNEDD